MTISVDELLAHSYVLTQGGEGLRRFGETFERHGLLPQPVPYTGRRVDRTSREFALNRHFIAAHASHLEIVERAQKDGWPFVCIFEEDAYPCRDVRAKLAKALQSIPDDAYLLRLGYVPFDGRFIDRAAEIGIERLAEPRYLENYLGGSHAYIVFRSFYEQNAAMLARYRTSLLAEASVRNINHPNALRSEERETTWFYEWIMAPNLYRHPLQARMYSVAATDNLFVQPEYVMYNATTRSLLGEFPRVSALQRFVRRLGNLWHVLYGGLK